MFNLGFKYHNHKENHYSKDTQHTVKKEVIKNGRCLIHQDIIITRLGGLFTNECKRCAEEYKLRAEIDRIQILINDSINGDIIESQTSNIQLKMETNSIKTIDEEPIKIINEKSEPKIDEPIKTIEGYIKQIEEPIKIINENSKPTIDESIKTINKLINKRIDNEFNREIIYKIKKNQCRCCNRQKNGRFDTCCQACISGTHTFDCNNRKMKEEQKQIKEEEKKQIKKEEKKQIKEEEKQTKKKNPNKSSYLKREVDKNIKYPFISKITDKSVTLNDITYTLCEVKLLERSRDPTSKILTQMWIKYKYNGKKINPNPRFAENINAEIYDTETEYIFPVDAICRAYNDSYFNFNGTYIVSDGPDMCCNPLDTVVDGEIVQIPRHISDIFPTFKTRKWYNFTRLNSKPILKALGHSCSDLYYRI